MKKVMILILVNVGFVISTFSQSFYNDAMRLDSLLKDPIANGGKIKSLLSYYQSGYHGDMIDIDTLINKFNSIDGLEKISVFEASFGEIKQDEDIVVVWGNIFQLLEEYNMISVIGDTVYKIQTNINALVDLREAQKILTFSFENAIESILDTLGQYNKDTLKVKSLKESLKLMEITNFNTINKSSVIKDIKSITENVNDYQKNVTEIKNKEKNIRNQIDKIYLQLLTKNKNGIILIQQFKKYQTATTFIKPQVITMPSYVASNSAQTLSMPSESEIIDALAVFLVKRFKEEMALEFVDQIKTYLVNNPDIQIVFPNTWEKMKSLERFEQPDFGKDWQNAFAEDVISLPVNIWNTNLIQESKDTDYKKLFLIGKMIYEKKHITEIITLMDLDRKGKCNLTPIDTLIGKFAFLNKILYSEDSNRYWISFSELQGMTDNQFKIFIALINEKYKDDIEKLGLGALINEGPNFKTILLKYLLECNNLENIYLSLQKQLDVAPQSSFDFTAIWEKYSNMFRVVSEFTTTKIAGTNNKKMMEIADHAFFVYAAIERGDYAEVITQSLDALSLITYKELIDESEMKISFKLMETWAYKAAGCNNKCFENMPTKAEVHNIINKCSAAKSGSQIECTPECKSKINYELYTIINEFNNSCNLDTFEIKLKECFTHSGIPDSIKTSIIAVIEKYKVTVQNENTFFTKLKDLSSFIGDAMYAESSKELTDVIDAHAASPTSYKIKRYTRFSLDLSSYITLYIGNEWDREKRFSKTSPSGVYGFSAIIGPSLSFGDRKSKSALYNSKYELYSTCKNELRFLNGFSHSITFSIFDIGAVVSYRFADTATGLPKDVNFAQVFAPGIHYMYGIRETPLTISSGIQFTPLLRDISEEVRLDNTIRAYIGISFDIPLFNFYYKPNFK